MANVIKWDDHFKIGVDVIDQAHHGLFSIVRRIIRVSVDEKSSQWAGAEGIKYFKYYAIRHFAEEEEYMQKIGYSGYEMHKQLHDDMRYKTLPALERELEKSGYSQEALHHFLGICLGWLTGHIMIEDRAITGKIANKWDARLVGSETGILESAASDVFSELFKLPAEVVSEYYSGEDFGECKVFRLIYSTKDERPVQIFLVLEEEIILHTVGGILGMKLNKIDPLVINAAKELLRQLMKGIGLHFPMSGEYRLESGHVLSAEQFQKEFAEEYPYYSILMDTGVGYFAICIKI